MTVGGTIDRVDAYHRSEGTYVRVVDYKTGKKEFRLSDVLHGLNMQMLVYLAALVENGQVLPAGILYMPAAEPSVSAQKGIDVYKRQYQNCNSGTCRILLVPSNSSGVS